MQPIDQDIIAALLKSVWEHGLIPEATYRAALNKLFCTFDVNGSIGYDDKKQCRGVYSYGYSENEG